MMNIDAFTVHVHGTPYKVNERFCLWTINLLIYCLRKIFFFLCLEEIIPLKNISKKGLREKRMWKQKQKLRQKD